MQIEAVGESIALDSKERNASVNFVSHAHSDHIAGVSGRCNPRVLSSPETIALLHADGISGLLPVSIKNATLLNAGHVLGSRQLYIEDEERGYSFIYTGDYQMQSSRLAGKIETRNADIAIIDSTYPWKHVRFDERHEVIDAIESYIAKKLGSGIVLFSAYHIGKAQELIEIANRIGIVPVVSKEISRISRVYNGFGADLKYVSAYDGNAEFEEAIGRNFLGITSSSKITELGARLQQVHGKRVYTAVATGFAKVFRFGTDVQFPLSDHADFWQALDYISKCSPNAVYTVGKNRAYFAKNLQSVGINAHPFEEYHGMAALAEENPAHAKRSAYKGI